MMWILISGQRYLKMMGKTNEPVTEIKVSGLNFSDYKKKETTFEELAKPGNHAVVYSP